MSIGGEFVAGGSLSQLMSALDLLTDPKKFQTKLAQLGAAEGAAAQAIKDANLVADLQVAKSDIENQLAQASRTRNEAQTVLNAAYLQAKELVANAEKDASDTKLAAKAYQKALADQAELKLKEATTKVNLMVALEEKLKLGEAELAIGFTAIAERDQELAELKLSLEADRESMVQVQKNLERVFATLKD